MNKLTLHNLNLKDFVLRIGLVGTGISLFTVGVGLWESGWPAQQPLHLGLSYAAWLAGIILFILALVTDVDARASWCILIGLIGVQLGYAYLQQLNYSPLTTNHTDNEMIAEFAAQALKRGQNPYEWNFTDIFRVYRDTGVLATPFLDGATQNRVTHPILSTLLIWIFGLGGMGQARTVSLVFHLILLCLLFCSAPPNIRPIILLPLFILREFIFFTLGGVQDVVWSALLVGVVFAWQHPARRAVLFGLAASFRQQPWFVAPFLLVQMWNEPGTRPERYQRVIYFVTVSIGVFGLINLPFILWNPRAWLLGTFEPSYAQFNIYCQGLGAISQYGLAHLPRIFYTFLQFSALLIMLLIHWRHPQLVGQAFWIFPGIFFWLYYRALASYWIYWIPPLLLALTRHLNKDKFNPTELLAPRPGLPRTVAFSALVLGINLFLGIFFLLREPLVKINLDTYYGEGLIDRFAVSVSNQSAKTIAPRFAVQSAPGIQALPWTIESGPEQLAPGTSGKYVISAKGFPHKTFVPWLGGQIVLTDAGGDYRMRAVLPINGTPIQREDTVSNMLAHPEVYYINLGDEYFRQRNYDSALDAYQRALTYNPQIKVDSSLAAAYDGLGQLMLQQNRCAEAVAYFEQALALVPNLAEAQSGIAKCQSPRR